LIFRCDSDCLLTEAVSKQSAGLCNSDSIETVKMEFKMKNIMRRQILALMLGVTALAIAASVSHRAFAEDSHSGQDDSSHHDSASGDDGPDHDANDDNGGGSDDGANHDANDDNGGDNDDGPDHDANDDSGGGSDDESSNSSSGAGNSDCAIASVNCSKKAHKK
jgi:hypothetical protein